MYILPALHAHNPNSINERIVQGAQKIADRLAQILTHDLIDYAERLALSIIDAVYGTSRSLHMAAVRIGAVVFLHLHAGGNTNLR